MRRTARRTGRRLTLLAALTTALVAASCSASRSAEPSASTDAPTVSGSEAESETSAAVDSTDVVGSTSEPDDIPATTAAPTTAAPTTEPAPTTTERPVITPAMWDALGDQLAVRLMSAGNYTAGYAVAVDGEVVYTGAVGDRVPTPDRPNQATDSTTTTATSTTTSTTSTTTPARPPEAAAPTDRFRIASISKVITATLVMQLVEDGAVELDEPVLAGLAAELDVTITDPAVATITLRQLLAHTSGFGVYQPTFFRGGATSCEDAAAQGLTGGLEAPPGTVYGYSNMNFCILGLLVEQLAGEPYEQVATERLLEPLGIEGMRLAGTFDARPDEVQHPSVPTRNYMEALGGAGAWVASAEDVVRIVDSLDPAKPGWHPLPDDVLRYMRLASDGVVYNNIADRWYGLGLIVWADGSWGHTGTIENTHAMVVDRPDGITWSILVNGEYPAETTRLRDIFDDAVEAAGLPIGTGVAAG